MVWLSILLIGFFIILIIITLFLLNKETFVSIHPPNSHSLLRNRKKIDRRLKKISSKIIGTKKTPIYIIDNYLTHQECKKIINIAKKKLTPSTLTRNDPNDKYFRTSKTGYFSKSKFEKEIEKKLCKTLNLPKASSEASQVQSYDVGNEFKAHHDWFDSKFDKDYWKNGQRTWTFMIYLNNVEGGGTTDFVNLGEKIIPKEGMAVIWSNLDNKGNVDHDTKHCGTPVTKGKKFIITKWFKDTININI